MIEMIYLVICTYPEGNEYVEATFKDKADAEKWIDNLPDNCAGAYRIDERILQ
jgi:hypothetical protein